MIKTRAVPTSLRRSSPLKLLAMVVFGSSLVGCASNYKAVKEGDLEQIQAQLTQTERALAQLEKEQAASRDLLFTAEQDSLRRMISALQEQVKPPECPVVEVSPEACQAVAAPRALPAQPQASAVREGKLIVGEVEKVFVDPPGVVYQARIDTGAESASLDARDVQEFERDGERWVRFKMPLPDSEGLVDVERKVSRFVRILQSSAEEADRRPVIKLRIVIGNVERLVEFTLSDREHLEFPILIGRNVLKDSMIVDVSRANSVSLPKELRNSESPNE